ncbi:MAG: putative phosphatidoglycerophosphate synthase [Elusimicrobia bacterium]|nr:MAG: putative phosphatidoglycerophosphate synthase [Elusimicrobiota bacterium]KAF0154011.1 MAG: putative phosphatidoglycerophosphate synthase [Elusimicrobiota bacterium]
MLERTIRPAFQKVFVAPLVGLLLPLRLNPDVLTVAGGAAGVAAAPLLYFKLPWAALGALLLSGWLDTIDGSYARARGVSSEKGSALDIVSDRAVEFSVTLGLFLYAPGRGLECVVMLGSMLLCVTSFLVVGIFEKNSSQKSFHYSEGLMERAESFIFFGLMMLFPAYFSPLAWVFSALVFYTAAVRMYEFYFRRSV